MIHRFIMTPTPDARRGFRIALCTQGAVLAAGGSKVVTRNAVYGRRSLDKLVKSSFLDTSCTRIIASREAAHPFQIME